MYYANNYTTVARVKPKITQLDCALNTAFLAIIGQQLNEEDYLFQLSTTSRHHYYIVNNIENSYNVIINLFNPWLENVHWMNNVHIRDEVDEKAVSDGCLMWWNIYFTRVRELNILKISWKRENNDALYPYEVTVRMSGRT